MDRRRWKRNRTLPLIRQLVQRRAAGIWHPHHARDLIKALPHRIVARTADDRMLTVSVRTDNRGMASGGDKGKERGLKACVHQIICRDMSLDMVDRDKRLSPSISEGFGKIYADKQRTDKARPICHGNSIELTYGKPAALQRLICNAGDRLAVRAACDFRNDAPEPCMHSDLRRHDIRKNRKPPILIFHDSGGRFVAGAFKSKNSHILPSPSGFCKKRDRTASFILNSKGRAAPSDFCMKRQKSTSYREKL